MSRTTRRPAYRAIRHPRGHKAARASGARSIPPSARADLPVAARREGKRGKA